MIFLSLFLSQAMAMTSMSPTAFPVFLKEGFSSILEFEETPSQVVLGDQNLFQVEKLNRSIIIKPLTAYATTNMFVYFKFKETRLFILTAAEDVEPTFYKKFSTIIPKASEPLRPKALVKYVRGAYLKSAEFNKKKDYLTVDLVVTADSTSKLLPSWDLIRLKYNDRVISPSKLWSERREVQRDSLINARLIFMKPNIPADMKDTTIMIPIKGATKSLMINLKRNHL
jgi:hypothetical protein